MMDEVIVVLAPNFTSTFRRTVRGPAGESVEVLTFNPGEPVRIPEDLFAAIKGDLGHSILVCAENASGFLTHDFDATKEFKEYLDCPPEPKAEPEVPVKKQPTPVSKSKRKKTKTKPKEVVDEPEPADGGPDGPPVSEPE